LLCPYGVFHIQRVTVPVGCRILALAHVGVDGVIIPGHCIGTSDPFSGASPPTVTHPTLKRNRAADIQEFGFIDKEWPRWMQLRDLRNQFAGWIDSALSVVCDIVQEMS
jgi:hypothetical protein